MQPKTIAPPGLPPLPDLPVRTDYADSTDYGAAVLCFALDSYSAYGLTLIDVEGLHAAIKVSAVSLAAGQLSDAARENIVTARRWIFADLERRRIDEQTQTAARAYSRSQDAQPGAGNDGGRPAPLTPPPTPRPPQTGAETPALDPATRRRLDRIVAPTATERAIDRMTDPQELKRLLNSIF